MSALTPCAWCNEPSRYLTPITDEDTGQIDQVCNGCAMDAVVSIKVSKIIPDLNRFGALAIPEPHEPLPRRNPANGETIYIT